MGAAAAETDAPASIVSVRPRMAIPQNQERYDIDLHFLPHGAIVLHHQ